MILGEISHKISTNKSTFSSSRACLELTIFSIVKNTLSELADVASKYFLVYSFTNLGYFFPRITLMNVNYNFFYCVSQKYKRSSVLKRRIKFIWRAVIILTSIIS